jgi:hypothetical protein
MTDYERGLSELLRHNASSAVSCLSKAIEGNCADLTRTTIAQSPTSVRGSPLRLSGILRRYSGSIHLPWTP